jgi:hypothetical protein
MKDDALRTLLAFLKQLDQAKIAWALDRCRDDAIMVKIDVPGQRWEVELVDYGDEFQWEVERFVKAGAMEDESVLEELFDQFSDEEAPATHDATART